MEEAPHGSTTWPTDPPKQQRCLQLNQHPPPPPLLLLAAPLWRHSPGKSQLGRAQARGLTNGMQRLSPENHVKQNKKEKHMEKIGFIKIISISTQRLKHSTHGHPLESMLLSVPQLLIHYGILLSWHYTSILPYTQSGKN